MNTDQQNMTLSTRAARMTIQVGVAVLLAFSATAYAAPTLDDQVVAGPCVNCHGPEGRSPGAIPSIAGLPEAELKAKLLEFKSDGASTGSTASNTAGTTIMNRLAKGYSDAQIAVLAHYYAQMKPAAGTGTGAKP